MCSCKLTFLQNAIFEQQKICRIKIKNSTGHVKIQTTRGLRAADLPEVLILLHMILQNLPSINMLVVPLRPDKVKQHVAPPQHSS